MEGSFTYTVNKDIVSLIDATTMNKVSINIDTLQATLNEIKIKKFTDYFMNSNKNLIDLIRETLLEGLIPYYRYDILGCFDVRSIKGKSIKVVDITNKVTYIPKKEFTIKDYPKQNFYFKVYEDAVEDVREDL
jgi:hypothetical protein